MEFKPVRSTKGCLVLSAVAAGLFVCLTWQARFPDFINRPMALEINRVFIGNSGIGNVLYWITYPKIEGVAVSASICFCWFAVARTQLRALLLGGIIAAVFAGALGQILQSVIASSPKPLFDPVLNLRAPSAIGDIIALRADTLHNMDTFPSPRAAMFLGIALAVWLVHRRIGAFVVLIAVIPELARVFIGLHYPTDIVGSFLLAAPFVWLTHTSAVANVVRHFILVEEYSPAIFYTGGFIALSEIANTFDDVRYLFSVTSRILR